MNMDLQDRAPAQAFAGGQYAWGRYRQPVVVPNVRAAGAMGKYRLKEWHYHSLVTDQWFLGLAVVQLGYLANAFCYLVDRKDPGRKYEYEALLPLGKGLTFAESSVSGTTRLENRKDRVVFSCGKTWGVSLDLPLAGKRLVGEFSCQPEESLALLFPLEEGRRAAYTHKAAGMRASGGLDYGGTKVDLSGAGATLDWTRSVASRTTRWKWASFAGLDMLGRRVGLNLSADVYDLNGESLENALWIDGKVRPLDGVVFEMPRKPLDGEWHIRSRRGDELDLTFKPLGARQQSLNLGLLKSEFVQPYGTFTGKIQAEKAVELKGIFGVVENHLSVW